VTCNEAPAAPQGALWPVCSRITDDLRSISRQLAEETPEGRGQQQVLGLMKQRDLTVRAVPGCSQIARAGDPDDLVLE
jgi:hypothetical protein